MRILLVEDHEEIWDFLSRRLRRRGYEVDLATDGQAAVDKAASVPDVILLDMNLPIMDGWTAAGLIKADAATAGIPIIALTAHAMSGDQEKRSPPDVTTTIPNRWTSRASSPRSRRSAAARGRPERRGRRDARRSDDHAERRPFIR